MIAAMHSPVKFNPVFLFGKGRNWCEVATLTVVVSGNFIKKTIVDMRLFFATMQFTYTHTLIYLAHVDSIQIQADQPLYFKGKLIEPLCLFKHHSFNQRTYCSIY